MCLIIILGTDPLGLFNLWALFNFYIIGLCLLEVVGIVNVVSFEVSVIVLAIITHLILSTRIDQILSEYKPLRTYLDLVVIIFVSVILLFLYALLVRRQSTYRSVY